MNRRSALQAISLLAGGALLAPRTAFAHSYKIGHMSIGHIWAPPPVEGAHGLPVYGPLLNNGEQPVRLVEASSPIAKDVTFRVDKQGAYELLPFLTIAPGTVLALAAWREHLWVSGLEKIPGTGASIPLTLTFEGTRRFEIDVEAVVETSHTH